jgi:hypothetical protein
MEEAAGRRSFEHLAQIALGHRHIFESIPQNLAFEQKGLRGIEALALHLVNLVHRFIQSAVFSQVLGLARRGGDQLPFGPLRSPSAEEHALAALPTDPANSRTTRLASRPAPTAAMSPGIEPEMPV